MKKKNENSEKKEETKLREELFQLVILKKHRKTTEFLVEQIKKNNHIYTTRDDIRTECWIYDDGIYKPQGKTFIKEFCRNLLLEAYTSFIVNEVITKIEADTFIEQEKLFENKYPYEIPVLNGILNIITKKISPFTPKKIFFNKIPVIYNPKSKCPKIEKHFEDVLKDKSDKKVMFELFGYCLLKLNKLDKAFMFVGDGNNGKTKTLELIKIFMGIENTTSVPLSQIKEDSFRIYELFGKMVNIAGDIGNKDLKETGLFKSTCSDELISSKRKFLRDLSFMNYAKHIFSCNQLPRVYDFSLGFWRRWILLEFPYEFINQNEYSKLTPEEKKFKKIKDLEIVKKITSDKELSGLLNKALDSLSTILKNKQFSYSKGTQEVKELWIRKSDSFTAFCIDCIEEEPTGIIKKKLLRQIYFQYCKRHNLKGTSDKAIKVSLESMFGATENQIANGDRVWEGILFKQGTFDEFIKNPIQTQKI